MMQKVGRFPYDLLYAPSARKLYGVSPTSLSAAAARVRSWHRDAFRIINRMLSGREKGSKFYYYPRQGIGTIAERLKEEFLSRGGTLWTGADRIRIRMEGRKATEVECTCEGETRRARMAAVVSTVPASALLDMVSPAVPERVHAAARALHWRGLRFLYLSLPRNTCGTVDTYYFPEQRCIFGRISQPKQLSPALMEDERGTVLCVEIPCTPGDALWQAGDAQLFAMLEKDLTSLGLIGSGGDVARCFSRRLSHVYPVYDANWESNFQTVTDWLGQGENIFPVGRTALFLHVNIDHCIEMGLQCADFVLEGAHGSGEWIEHTKRFRTFRVRD